jgi:hypothetical protein
MHSTRLLGAAVVNNASWCDAVCRAHGYPGTFSSRLWTSTAHRLRLYPHAITLHPETAAPEVLAVAATARPFAVKDSFARLDLAPAGFRLLTEASWIARDGAPDGSLSWDTVTSPGELGDWEAARAAGGSDDGPVFRPGLLADPRCTVLACREEDAIIAGAVVYAAGGAAGFPWPGYGPASSRPWPGCIRTCRPSATRRAPAWKPRGRPDSTRWAPSASGYGHPHQRRPTILSTAPALAGNHG